MSSVALSLRAAQERVALLLKRFVPTERQRLLALTVFSGALCGLVAVSFHLAIARSEHFLIERALSTPGYTWIFWSILTPALGGLVVGLGLVFWVPGAVGSGVPQVKVAYALHSGYIPIKEAFGKFVLCVVQLGTGASSGREGPTVQICAGISSWLARTAGLSRQNQRRMAAVGVAAGIAAAFNAPMAAVTFTLEEVIGDLDQTMLSGVIVAAAVAAVVEHTILGQHPVFEVQHAYTLVAASSLLWYAVLGVLSSFIAVAFTDSLLTLRAGFKRFTAVPKWTHPMFGGLLTGALAVVALTWLRQNGINGAGYATLSLALAGSLPIHVLLGLCLRKFVATAFSYGSGSVGGIFAPSLFLGGNARRSGRLGGRKGLWSPHRFDRSFRAGRDGGCVRRNRPRTHDVSSDDL